MFFFKNVLTRDFFEVVLKELCIKMRKKKWKFFSKNRKFDLDMVWDHDNYWKTSPGSILEGFNNGLKIFYDLDEIFNKISAHCKTRLKTRFSNFFEKYQKSMCRFLRSLWHVQRWKKHVRIMFPRCWYDWKNFKIKFFLKIFYAIFY